MHITVRSSKLSSRRGRLTQSIMNNIKLNKYYLLVDGSGNARHATKIGTMGMSDIAKVQWDRKMGERVFTAWSTGDSYDVVMMYKANSLARLKEGFH